MPTVPDENHQFRHMETKRPGLLLKELYSPYDRPSGVLLLRAVKWLKLMAVSYQPAQFGQFFLVLA